MKIDNIFGETPQKIPHKNDILLFLLSMGKSLFLDNIFDENPKKSPIIKML